MSNPAFLIDGFMEKLVLEKICPNTRVNRINCNGNSVSITAMAKRICTLIKILNNKYYPILIIIDREDRQDSPAKIIADLENEIKSSGINDDIRIGVCDRMIENWLLADWETFKESSGIDKELELPPNIEGASGKSLVKKYYPNYQETTEGVEFFLKADPIVMSRNSESFRHFVEKTRDLDCFWINNLFNTIEELPINQDL